MISAKKCCRCGLLKPILAFAWKNRRRGTRAKDCRECHAVHRKAYYEANKEKEKSYTVARIKSLSRLVRDYKAERHCIKCGEDHPACLDFHHRDQTKKEVGMSVIARLKGWSKERIMREIAKCDILCANCHRKVHWKAPETAG